MGRSVYLLFAFIAYLVFFATFLYLIAFVGALPLVPHTIDFGNDPMAELPSILIDLALIGAFGVQHSVMARPKFKAKWTRVAPDPIERSIYVLVASATLILLFALWQPLPTIVWQVHEMVAVGAIWAVFGLGWLIVLLSTFLLNHFELFGLKQVWDHVRQTGQSPAVFRTPLFYKLVRHPLYSGFLLAFWATPLMTLGHLLFALGMTTYILIAIRYEERDLIEVLGPQYEDYRRQVGMLLPGIGRSR
jgi:methanethiol S-methyltransferase